MDFSIFDDRFRIRDVDLNDPAVQVSMALIMECGSDIRCVGTATLVAPGLATTAAHVIDGCVRFQRQRDGYKRPGTNFSLTAFQLSGDRVWIWQVDAIYASGKTDIAFLRFRKPDSWESVPDHDKPRLSRLNLSPPAVGDMVEVFGFPDSKLEDGVLVVSPSRCTCRVTAVGEKLSYLSPHWRIEVQGSIDSGMSGGACFDADGNMIGVNSSGFEGE